MLVVKETNFVVLLKSILDIHESLFAVLPFQFHVNSTLSSRRVILRRWILCLNEQHVILTSFASALFRVMVTELDWCTLIGTRYRQISSRCISNSNPLLLRSPDKHRNKKLSLDIFGNISNIFLYCLPIPNIVRNVPWLSSMVRLFCVDEKRVRIKYIL